MVVSIPIGDRPGWKQFIAEDFLTATPAGTVSNVYGIPVYDGFADTSKNGTYRANSLSVRTDVAGSNGALTAFIRTVAGVPTVAAPVPGGYSGRTYGRYSVRMKADNLPKYKVAFMLWPDEDAGHPGGDWTLGEIDFPEGNLNTGNILDGNQHEVGPNPANTPYPFPLGVTAQDWHDYTMEWLPNVIRYYVDDVLIQSTTRDIPNTPHHWVLQIETHLTAQGVDLPDPATQGNVYIDWVAAWAPIAGYDYGQPKGQSFVGANSSTLPAPVTSVLGTNAIASNRLNQTTPTSQWSVAQARLNTRFTDGYVQAQTRLTSLSSTAYLGVRFNPTTNQGYAVSLSGSGALQFGWWNNANYTTLANVAMTLTAGTDYEIKVEARAGGYRVKVWPTLSTEPVAWSIPELYHYNNSGARDIVLMTQTRVASANSASWGAINYSDMLYGANDIVLPTEGVSNVKTLEERLRDFALAVAADVKALQAQGPGGGTLPEVDFLADINAILNA